VEIDNQKHRRPWSKSKIKLVRYLLPLLLIGLAIHLLLPQIASLENSIKVMRSMSPQLVCLAAIAQVCSYLGSGYMLKALTDLGQSRLSIVRGTLITLASYSIGLVTGSWVGEAAATYHWVEKSEDVSEEASLAAVLPFLFNEAMLVIVTVIGLVYLLISHNLTHSQLIAYCSFLTLLVIGILVVFYAARHPDIVVPLVSGVIDRLSNLIKSTYKPSEVRKVLENIYAGLALLQRSGWYRPAIGSGMNICFDMLTLYLLFIAAGYPVTLGVLMAGYGLAFLFGKIAFIFPGGIGVIEGGMAAIFTNLGVPASISIVVVLSYRLLSFWIPTLLGFAVSGYLQRTPEKSRSARNVL
jgi:glycosyltransferase 2 family protein